MRKDRLVTEMLFLIADTHEVYGFPEAWNMALNYRTLCSSLFGIDSPERKKIDNHIKEIYFNEYAEDLETSRKSFTCEVEKCQL